MERRKFLKQLIAVTAGAIVTVPMASALINEKPKYNVDLATDTEVEHGGWSSLMVTIGNDIYFNGMDFVAPDEVWNRKLTDEDPTNKKLLPDRTVQVWVNRKLKIENGKICLK